MPAAPGDQLLTTLFADIHYYFDDPSSKPSHDRFAKGSYVYLYYNASSYQTKLEIANHAGTPDQDAFHGYLQAATVKYNHLQPGLVSFIVDPQAVQDHQTWHLPGYDVKNEQKYLYKICSLDVYLWTEKDAATFLNHVKGVLAPDRLDIKNAPASQGLPEHRDSMSSVVQQLERTAIVSNFLPRTTSVVSTHSMHVPGPPTPHSSLPAAPGAYNPAAPAAPEPVTYREKTPPPPDDGSGTGLQAAASYDRLPQQPQLASSSPGIYQSSAQTTPQAAYFGGGTQQPQSNFPGPPTGLATPESQRPQFGGVPPPPTQSPPAQTRAPSFGPMAASTIGSVSPPPNQTSFRQSSFGPPVTQHATSTYNPQTQYANYPMSPGFNQQPPTPSAPPAYAGHTPMQSPGMPPPPAAQSQQQVPIGGFSNYSYTASQQPDVGQFNLRGAYTGDLHAQAYRPTEFESVAHGAPKIKRAQTSQDGSMQSKNSKLQENVGKAESKVSKLFGKLDKFY